MLNIAICDDEIFFCKVLHKIISNYCIDRNIPFQITIFSSGKDLVSLGASINQFHIVYLDINMKELNGIETAKYLRYWSHSIFIVFVTASLDFILAGYKVEAFRYILKNKQTLGTNIQESLDTIAKKLNKKSNIHRFCFKEGNIELPTEKIIYIESSLHTLQFHTITQYGEKIYTMSGKLSILEDQLPKEYFVRMHQSYLVNLRYIKKISNYQAFLWNNSILPVARSRYNNSKEKFLIYQENF